MGVDSPPPILYTSPFTPMTKTSARRYQTLMVLAQNFKQELANEVYQDERFIELLHNLTADFVEKNIPLVDEGDQMELAILLFSKIKVTSY